MSIAFVIVQEFPQLLQAIEKQITNAIEKLTEVGVGVIKIKLFKFLKIEQSSIKKIKDGSLCVNMRCMCNAESV
jgi:hypothetical protein